jgi:hypothetical protein
MTRARVFVGFLCVFCVIAPQAQAQSIQLGVEARRDRFTYHFDNPSSIDTPGPVPHFFEQRFVADNLWLVASARYAVGVEWETVAGATPKRTGTGDDYDTFFDPNGSVVVSGTTGGISIWSWRVSQTAVVGFAKHAKMTAGYRLRVDRADWQLGHSTTYKDGRLTSAYDTTAPEITVSHLQEFLAGVRAESTADHAWQFRFDGEVAPLAAGRLLIQLPEKYPGQDLVFQSRGGAGTVSLALAHPRGPVPLVLSVEAGRTWSYQNTASLARDTLAARVSIGR